MKCVTNILIYTLNVMFQVLVTFTLEQLFCFPIHFCLVYLLSNETITLNFISIDLSIDLSNFNKAKRIINFVTVFYYIFRF
jgi:hypothetical protein